MSKAEEQKKLSPAEHLAECAENLDRAAFKRMQAEEEFKAAAQANQEALAAYRASRQPPKSD